VSSLRGLMPRQLQPVVRRAYRNVGPPTARLRMEPDFIVIGGQRCGTTSIFKALAEHPQVMRPPVDKGTDYYTLYSTRGLDWYRGHFPLRSTARLRSGRLGRPVAFEACTYYMFHPFALERLATDYPNVRLVAMLRDPVERAFSAYKHELARGFETEPDFERALDLEQPRLAGELERMECDPDYESIAHRHHAYTSRGEYAVQLQRAFRFFAPEQVHVLESEAFFSRPAEIYTALTRFLGLNDYLPRRFDQFNARPGSPMTESARQRLEQHYRQHDAALTDLLHRAPSWLTQG
jgi:hypothetical protein